MQDPMLGVLYSILDGLAYVVVAIFVVLTFLEAYGVVIRHFRRSAARKRHAHDRDRTAGS